MIPEEYLRRIRHLDVKTRHLADDVFAGEYRSVFKGRGMDFEEVREYSDGDDVRQMHWNVTARTGVAHVKKYREERELSLHLLVDVSASGEMASGGQSKRELSAEIASCLAYSAIRNRDRVGLMLFSDRIERQVMPHKGRHHILRLIRDILYHPPVHHRTSLKMALEAFYHTQHRRSVVFLLSDFLDEGYERALHVVARKHDVIPVVIEDERERELPNAGWVIVQDAESGEILELDTSNPRVRTAYRENAAARRAAVASTLRRCGLTSVFVQTGVPYVSSLQKFFDQRLRHSVASGA